MTKEQRARYDTFTRVRGFGADHKELFPESSAGSAWFSEIAATIDAIDLNMKERVVARAEARKVKAEKRQAVEKNMKTIAGVARRMARSEPDENVFIMPRQRSLQALLSTARAFAEEGIRRQELFVRYGLPATFISEFQALVNTLHVAAVTRQTSKTTRNEAQAAIEAALESGIEVIRNLDYAVEVATRPNPAQFAAWKAARRIQGLRSSNADTSKATQASPTANPPAAVVAPTDTPASNVTPDPAARQAS